MEWFSFAYGLVAGSVIMALTILFSEIHEMKKSNNITGSEQEARHEKIIEKHDRS